jgi:hypothetical protein
VLWIVGEGGRMNRRSDLKMKNHLYRRLLDDVLFRWDSIAGKGIIEISLYLGYAMFRGEKTFAQQPLQHALHARSMDQLQNE